MIPAVYADVIYMPGTRLRPRQVGAVQRSEVKATESGTRNISKGKLILFCTHSCPAGLARYCYTSKQGEGCNLREGGEDGI